MKVDDILRSRGFGKSTEDISKVFDKSEEIVGFTSTENTTTVAAGKTESNGLTQVAVTTDENLCSKIINSLEAYDTISSPNVRVSKLSSNENQSVPTLDQAPSRIEEVSNNCAHSKNTVSFSSDGSSPSLEPYMESDISSVSTLINENLAVPFELNGASKESTVSSEGSEISVCDRNNERDFLVENCISAPVLLNVWNEKISTAVPERVGKLSNHVEEDMNVREEEGKSAINGPIDFHSSDDVSKSFC